MNTPAVPGQPGQPSRFVPPSGGNYGSIREKVEAERRAILAKERAEQGEMPPQEESLPPEWAQDVQKAVTVGERIMGSKVVGFQFDHMNGSAVALELEVGGKKVVLAFNPTEDARFLPGIIDTTEELPGKAPK
jgi:hypothetical protein